MIPATPLPATKTTGPPRNSGSSLDTTMVPLLAVLAAPQATLIQPKIILILGNPNPYNLLYKPSFHFIFHFLFHLILHIVVSIFFSINDPCAPHWDSRPGGKLQAIFLKPSASSSSSPILALQTQKLLQKSKGWKATSSGSNLQFAPLLSGRPGFHRLPAFFRLRSARSCLCLQLQLQVLKTTS